MSLELSISPHGHPSAHWEPGALGAPEDHAFDGLIEGFATGAGSGLLCLVTEHLTSTLSVSLGFARDFAKVYMVALCQHAPSDAHVDLPQIAPPAEPKL